VLDHVELIHRSVGSRMQWDLAAASFAHTSDSGRREIQAGITQYLSFTMDQGDGTQDKHRIYDEMPGDQRVLAIGSSLENEGMEFLDRRPHHRAWLEDKGISPGDARLRYTQWRAGVKAAKDKRASGDGGDD